MFAFVVVSQNVISNARVFHQGSITDSLQRNFKQRSNLNTSVNKRFQAFESNHSSVPQMLAIDMNDALRSLSTFPYRVSIVCARLIYWRGFRSFELDQISELEWEARESEWGTTCKIA